MDERWLEEEGKRRYLHDALFHYRATVVKLAYPGASLEAIVATLVVAEYVPPTTAGGTDG